MTTTLHPPSAAAHHDGPRHALERGRRTTPRDDLLMVANLALLVTACIPLARVYVGLGFLQPVLGAVLLSFGLAWGGRRFGAGSVASLVVSIAGLLAFVSATFLSDTLAGGVIPTGRTMAAGAALWARGMELMRLAAAPAFAEAGLLLITVTGVWAVVHAVDVLVMRRHAPIRAVALALLLWTVPLALAPPSDHTWAWAVPFLAAAALLMLAFVGSDLARWGAWMPGGRSGRRVTDPSLLPTGGVLVLVAIVSAAVLAGSVPGFGETPWYQVRGTGGTAMTTNPIVDIRTRIVAQDAGPVMQVTAERPVYLRITSLDLYSETEEWTNDGIRAAPVDGTFPLEVPMGPVERVRLEVEVANLPSAVLVPAPYQALNVAGPLAESLQYDRRKSTVTLTSGRTLQRGDAYTIVAGVPSPTAEQLDSASVAAEPRLRQLPSSVPEEVRSLGADIVRKRDAQTPFQKALAIQDELRSWRYSTQPPQGHGGQAMLAFVRNRIGYCEQYAGTMAVMLRSLGLPARVAVGYTPGDLVDADSNAYTVTNGNAHAWVEVLFEGYGWIAFEPTPRSDGNVLVPSETTVAPARTAAQTEVDSDGTPNEQDFEAPQQDPDLRALQQQQREASEPTTSQPRPEGDGGSQGGGLRMAAILLGILGVSVIGAVVAASRGSRDLSARAPLERVLHARAAAERLGRGIGILPGAWETDHEYLYRLAERHGAEATFAAGALASHAAATRYALRLPEQAAVSAEAAAETLHREVVRGHSRRQRWRIALRGHASAWLSVHRRARRP